MRLNEAVQYVLTIRDWIFYHFYTYIIMTHLNGKMMNL